MTPEERLVADFRVAGLTVGPHPMAYRRAGMKKLGVRAAAELASIPSGRFVRVADSVIARQRPGTGQGFCVPQPRGWDGHRQRHHHAEPRRAPSPCVVRAPFLLVEGQLQKQDGVISVKAERVRPLDITQAETRSHDFH